MIESLVGLPHAVVQQVDLRAQHVEVVGWVREPGVDTGEVAVVFLELGAYLKTSTVAYTFTD